MDPTKLQTGNLSLVIEGPLSVESVEAVFHQKADLTYRTIRNVQVSKANIFQSLLTGSLIQHSTFYDVSFKRSDLDGLRAENTLFVRCDFSTCDIRSSVFSRCKFEECSFDGALIDDCEFKECGFISSGFREALWSRCRFNNSSLDDCNLSPGSFLHNKLYHSRLSNMSLGDCTFLYIILRNCELSNVQINVESVGMIFGLTKKQLEDSNLIFLGNDQPVPIEEDIVDLAFQEYTARKWWVGELLIAINFGLTSTVLAFRNYLSRSRERFIQLGFVKGDEIDFLGDLLYELAHQERLPFLVILEILEWCSDMEMALEKVDILELETAGNSLEMFAGRTALLANNLLANIEKTIAPTLLEDRDRPMCIKAVFDSSPNLAFVELLTAVNEASRLDTAGQTGLIRTEKGSYIEIVYTTLLTVLGFQLFLFLINGCIIQITEMKYRVKTLLQKKDQKNYRKMALSPNQQTSPVILTTIQALTKFATGLPLLKDVSLSGYGHSNVKSLQEVECEGKPGT